MSKLVAINLGHGDLNNELPRVTAQLWAAGHPLPEQFIGSYPQQQLWLNCIGIGSQFIKISAIANSCFPHYRRKLMNWKSIKGV